MGQRRFWSLDIFEEICQANCAVYKSGWAGESFCLIYHLFQTLNPHSGPQRTEIKGKRQVRILCLDTVDGAKVSLSLFIIPVSTYPVFFIPLSCYVTPSSWWCKLIKTNAPSGCEGWIKYRTLSHVWSVRYSTQRQYLCPSSSTQFVDPGLSLCGICRTGRHLKKKRKETDEIFMARQSKAFNQWHF